VIRRGNSSLEPVVYRKRCRLGTGLKRTAHQAVNRVAQAIVSRKTRVIDLDLRAYFDNVRHDQLLAKVARRIQDARLMRLLKQMLKSTGRKDAPRWGDLLTFDMKHTGKPSAGNLHAGFDAAGTETSLRFG
jgi:hypothetical protein